MKQTEDCKRWQKRFLVASGPRVWYFGKPGEPPAKARDVRFFRLRRQRLKAPRTGAKEKKKQKKKGERKKRKRKKKEKKKGVRV
jgi:hypothetical protein